MDGFGIRNVVLSQEPIYLLLRLECCLLLCSLMSGIFGNFIYNLIDTFCNFFYLYHQLYQLYSHHQFFDRHICGFFIPGNEWTNQSFLHTSIIFSEFVQPQTKIIFFSFLRVSQTIKMFIKLLTDVKFTQP